MILQIIILSGFLFGFYFLSCISTLSGFYFFLFSNNKELWLNSILVIYFNILNWVLLSFKNLNNIITFMPVNVGILIFTFNNIMKEENKFSLFFLITSFTTQVIVLCYNFNLIGYMYSKVEKNNKVISNKSFVDLEDEKKTLETDTTNDDDGWGYFIDTEK